MIYPWPDSIRHHRDAALSDGAIAGAFDTTGGHDKRNLFSYGQVWQKVESVGVIVRVAPLAERHN